MDSHLYFQLHFTSEYSPTVQQDENHTKPELVHGYRIVGDARHRFLARVAEEANQ